MSGLLPPPRDSAPPYDYVVSVKSEGKAEVGGGGGGMALKPVQEEEEEEKKYHYYTMLDYEGEQVRKGKK